MLRKKRVTNFLRAGILLLIFPVMYLALWVSISGNDALIYSEQVARMMSYLPKFAQNLRVNAFILLGMSGLSTFLTLQAWRYSESRKMQNFSLVICAVAAIITIWFVMSLV